MTGWDFVQGGEAGPRVVRDAEGLGAAVAEALASPAARCGASGAVLALKGVACRFGLPWRVEAQGAAVVVWGVRMGRAGRPVGRAVLVWRGVWTGAGALVGVV
jgi:hypothetical protein